MKITLLPLLLFVVSLVLVPSVQAQDDEYLLTEKTYNALNEAQEMMANEQYRQAGQRLNQLLTQTEEGSYDRAVVQQTIGYLYSEQEQYNRAAGAFEKALSADALPEDVTHNLRYNLAQILIADGQYQRGIGLMERWLANEAKPQNSVYVLLASAYYRLDNHSKVIEYIRTAIKNDPDPKEDWYRMQLSAHMSLRQYKSAINVLEILIPRYPHRKVYWDQLAALYQEQDKEFTSLAVRMLADRLDLGDAETLVNLADMYRYLRVPYKSGKLLQKAMDDGIIRSDFKHLQKLADSWMAAREQELAAKTLSRMLSMDSSGETHLRLGQVYVSMEQWQQAIDVLNQALERLEGSKQGRVHLLLGTSHFYLSQLEQAKASFGRAIAYENLSSQAGQWLRHIEDLLERQSDETAT
jgi:tetratricopeptide (TPR) repeat protein